MRSQRIAHPVDGGLPRIPYPEATMHEGHARSAKGGNAMTRPSITTVLGSILVGLLITISAPAVSAQEGSGGAASLAISASRDFSGYAQEQCEATIAAQEAAPSPDTLFAATYIGYAREQYDA